MYFGNRVAARAGGRRGRRNGVQQTGRYLVLYLTKPKRHKKNQRTCSKSDFDLYYTKNHLI